MSGFWMKFGPKKVKADTALLDIENMLYGPPNVFTYLSIHTWEVFCYGRHIAFKLIFERSVRTGTKKHNLTT